MNNNSNYKLHLPVVKLSTTQKISSVTPQNSLLVRDKYYENRVDKEWEQERFPIYNANILEGHS